MRGRLAAALLGVCALCQGCGPLAETARTMIYEPVEYPRRLEACVDWKRAEELAEAAWVDYLKAHPDGQYSISCDYGQGFKDGYADYLFAGGTGNPPPLAPRWYWRAENKTPEGRFGEQDWFQGFRTGAAAAKLSGYRQIETIGSWTSVTRTPPYTDGAAAAPNTDGAAAAPIKIEVLPPPTQVTPSPGPGAELAPPQPASPQPPAPAEKAKPPAP